MSERNTSEITGDGKRSQKVEIDLFCFSRKFWDISAFQTVQLKPICACGKGRLKGKPLSLLQSKTWLQWK